MAGTPLLELLIAQKSYRVAVPEGAEARVKTLAARVDALVSDMRAGSPTTDRDSLLVMACLQLAGELADALDRADGQATAVTRFHRDLAARLEGLLP